MKKLDIVLKINNIHEKDAVALYYKLATLINPLHPDTIKRLQEEIEEVLGYRPE